MQYKHHERLSPDKWHWMNWHMQYYTCPEYQSLCLYPYNPVCLFSIFQSHSLYYYTQKQKKCITISPSFSASPGQGHMTLVRSNMLKVFLTCCKKSCQNISNLWSGLLVCYRWKNEPKDQVTLALMQILYVFQMLYFSRLRVHNIESWGIFCLAKIYLHSSQGDMRLSILRFFWLWV